MATENLHSSQLRVSAKAFSIAQRAGADSVLNSEGTSIDTSDKAAPELDQVDTAWWPAYLGEGITF